MSLFGHRKLNEATNSEPLGAGTSRLCVTGLQPVERRFDHLFLDAERHSDMVLARGAEGAARGDDDFRLFQQADRKLV